MSGINLFALCFASFGCGCIAYSHLLEWATRKGYTIYDLKKKDGEK